jgi:hypothetical protein
LERCYSRDFITVLISSIRLVFSLGTVILAGFALASYWRFRRLPRELTPLLSLLCELVTPLLLTPLSRLIGVFYLLIQSGQADVTNVILFALGILGFICSSYVYVIARVFLGSLFMSSIMGDSASMRYLYALLQFAVQFWPFSTVSSRSIHCGVCIFRGAPMSFSWG